MIITGLNNTNPFPLLNDVYIDAANPYADANNLPSANNYPLNNMTDLGIYRNAFTNGSLGDFVYWRNSSAFGNLPHFVGDQFSSCQVTPYAVPNNNYHGPMTVTVAWITPDTSSGVDCRVFGREGTNGFSVGQYHDGYVFELIGSGSVLLSGQFTANVWQVCSMRFKTDNSVDFFKNGLFVANVAGFAMGNAVTELIFFSDTNSTYGRSWVGGCALLGWAWRDLTNAQISLLHGYAMGRVGI